MLTRQRTLPHLIDLRPYMSPIEYQGQVKNCAANAIVGAYEYLAYLRFGYHVDFSRLFLYYFSRKHDNLEVGSYISSNIQILKKFGVCTERTWPYRSSLIKTQPSYQAYIEARNYRLQYWHKLTVDLYTMKHVLTQRYPFVFGLKLFKSFARVDRSGWVAMPNLFIEEELQSHGRHAMLCVGFSDRKQVFIVRNSWGHTWGDRGYCYIPYNYLANPNYCFDVYAIYRFDK